MCDTININGKEISSIREDEACLCNSTVEEIGAFIFKELGLGFYECVTIERTPFSWEIKNRVDTVVD